MTFLIAMPPTTVRVYLIDLTSTYNSIYGPAARKKKKEARDTLALLAEGKALCTPSYEWMSV
jgi:endonuclease YncB( thermonuclease family)